MAAEMILQVLVSPLLGTVFDNLSYLIRSETSLVLGVNRELEKLSSSLSTIRDVLEDAEVKQVTDMPIRNWLRKLKDVAYDAEDILDECVAEALRSESGIIGTTGRNNIQVLNDLVSSCYNFKQILFRRKIAKTIETLREKFDEIAEERSKFHLNLNLNNRDVEFRVGLQRQTSSFPVESKVYGREEDKEYLVNNITDDYLRLLPRGYVSVCAIFGMAGLGKTTLAQMVYNDERIKNHFEVRCWVSVSQNFEQKTLLKAVLESVGESAHDLENLDPLQLRLQNKLSGKRFLVVLDDVWNEDPAKWNGFKSLLRCGRRGSSVIVTTRLQTVARITATLPKHVLHIKGLSEEDCWSLFKNSSFVDKEEVPEKLKAIGKEIVKKCGGVPLAAKFLGGLLCFKRKEIEWMFVRDSKIWNLPQDTEDAILPALRLSYNHLPPHLKQCFAYFSIFPKNCIMEKDEVIHLWIANGFVQLKVGMELEDVGNEIFNDLLWRSFFQDLKKDEENNILTFKMHDLVHDLACFIMGDECSVVEVDKADNIGKKSFRTRHFSFVFGYSSSSSFSTILKSSFPKNPPHLRTLLQFHRLPSVKQTSPLPFIFSNLKWLRVLDLTQADIRTVPDSIGNLKQLRYLNLSYTDITSLPNKSFCSLRNLQTLKLNGCHKLQMLPEDMTKISSLRHLYIKRCKELTRMPKGMGKLISLQTLSIFIVGVESGCGIGELQGLDLRGKLMIKAMEHVGSSADARIANLMRKKNLYSLSLLWSTCAFQITNEHEEVLEAIGDDLQCHENFKRLQVENYGGAKFPSWMMKVSCLPNLVKIVLVGCNSVEHLPPLGELRFLKVLRIKYMSSLKRIRYEFYHGDHHHHHQQASFFSSLEEFEISEMCNLEEWSSPSLPSTLSSSSSSSSSLSSFPRLKTLNILLCPKLRRCPPLPLSLQNLQLRECHDTLLTGSLCLPPRLSSLICLKLRSLPKELMENLTSLTSLEIKDCDELTYLSEGMQNLTSLESLAIVDCPQLELLPDDFQHLIALRFLHLVNLPKMTSLPLVTSHRLLKTLTSLEIRDCSGLTTLPNWLGNLRSLQALNILDCENLILLPQGVQQFLDAASMAMAPQPIETYYFTENCRRFYP